MTTSADKRRWLVVGLVFVAIVLNYVDRQILALLKPTLQAEFDWSDRDYSHMASAFQFAAALAFLGTGWFIDKVGLRWGFAIGVGVWSLAGILRDGRPEAMGTLSAALVDAALARCCYERDDLATAADLAKGALAAIEASPFQDALVSCYLVAIRVAAGTGSAGKAASLIDRAELTAFARGWMPLKAMCIVERARLRLPPTIDAETVLAAGDEETAIRDPLSVQSRAFALLAEMRAYEAIANGDRPRLTKVADHLLLLASAADDAELRASATLFNILPQLSGRCDKMVELETVRFPNAAASGFRRTIVDVLDVTGVRAVQNFCSEAYSSGSFLALLKLAEPSRRNPALEGGPGAAPGEAFSFLTEREIEILSALNAGESNKEIARSLQLAPETVKWHLKNVMRKLRAGSREEAVANAATLGLKLIEAH